MLTRREWLSMTAVGLFARGRHEQSGITPRELRIRRMIDEYEKQGFHRTATEVDRRSADWLAGEVRDAGLDPSLESFPIRRVDPVDVSVVVDGKKITGVPLFDGAFTNAAGIQGKLGALDGAAPIGLTDTAPNAAAAGPLGDARLANRHRAIVCVTRGARPGLCPSNADSFLKPFGPPVVQVSSEERERLERAARQGLEVHVIASVRRTAAQAFNVTASMTGTSRTALPLVIMTPRSGWWTCASERGGGIACWIEMMREFRVAPPPRDVLFVASSGHELGHLGINAFIDRREGIVDRTALWFHFGANIGAAQQPGNTIQASDDGFESRLETAMTTAGLTVDRRTPRGRVPGGEAEAVHRGGGRYVSVIGGNALFHNQADRGPGTVDVGAVSRFIDAFTMLARSFTA